MNGWQRWAVFFPTHVVQGPAGVDGLSPETSALVRGLVAAALAWPA